MRWRTWQGKEEKIVLRTVTAVALYCPHCGKLDLYDVSLFVLHRRDLTFRCACGYVKGVLTAQADRHYTLRVPCHLCGTEHVFVFSRQQFWRGQVDKIYCSSTNMELGFIGERSAVYGILDSCRRELDTASDEDGEWTNPEIMYGVLNKVHDIAERGGLYCRCGSHDIAMEILPDRLKLTCRRCGGTRELGAGTERDLAGISGLACIEVAGHCRTGHRW